MTTVSDAWSENEVNPRGSIDNVPRGYSMLEQYSRDWGYGNQLGEVYRKKRHECSWSVAPAVTDFEDNFEMGKAPIDPMSPSEIEDAVGQGNEKPAPEEGERTEGVATPVRVVRKLKLGTPDSAASLLRGLATYPTVAEGLAKAGARPSIGGDPTVIGRQSLAPGNPTVPTTPTKLLEGFEFYNQMPMNNGTLTKVYINRETGRMIRYTSGGKPVTVANINIDSFSSPKRD